MRIPCGRRASAGMYLAVVAEVQQLDGSSCVFRQPGELPCLGQVGPEGIHLVQEKGTILVLALSAGVVYHRAHTCFIMACALWGSDPQRSPWAERPSSSTRRAESARGLRIVMASSALLQVSSTIRLTIPIR